MFGFMREIGANLNEYLLSVQLDSGAKSFRQEFRDIFARYTTDIIASCAFGVQVNSLRNPECEFRKNSRSITTFTLLRAVEFTSVFFLPELVPWFRFKVSI